MDNLLKAMTRAKVLQIWFASAMLAVVGAVATGASISASAAAALLALCLTPPAIVLLLWPGAQPQTAAEVLHGVDRRA